MEHHNFTYAACQLECVNMKLFGHYCIVISKYPAGKKMASNIHPGFRQEIFVWCESINNLITEEHFFSSALRLPGKDKFSLVDMLFITCPSLADEISHGWSRQGLSEEGRRGTLQPSWVCESFRIQNKLFQSSGNWSSY